MLNSIKMKMNIGLPPDSALTLTLFPSLELFSTWVHVAVCFDLNFWKGVCCCSALASFIIQLNAGGLTNGVIDMDNHSTMCSSSNRIVLLCRNLCTTASSSSPQRNESVRSRTVYGFHWLSVRAPFPCSSSFRWAVCRCWPSAPSSPSHGRISFSPIRFRAILFLLLDSSCWQYRWAYLRSRIGKSRSCGARSPWVFGTRNRPHWGRVCRHQSVAVRWDAMSVLVGHGQSTRSRPMPIFPWAFHSKSIRMDVNLIRPVNRQVVAELAVARGSSSVALQTFELVVPVQLQKLNQKNKSIEYKSRWIGMDRLVIPWLISRDAPATESGGGPFMQRFGMLDEDTVGGLLLTIVSGGGWDVSFGPDMDGITSLRENEFPSSGM